MKPMGTITQYFPFIDVKTKSVLERVMLEASEYYDFVQRLGNLVLREESPIMVVYFAIHHSILGMDYPLIDKIRLKYGQHQILGPNLFMSSAFQGSIEDIKKVHEMADAIIASDPEEWIALEMHFMKFEADMRNYPTTMYKSSTMDMICKIIEGDPNYGYYEIILKDYLAIRAHHDGDNEGRLNCLNEGIELAEKFDDQVRVAHLLTRKAALFKGKDARILLERAYEIVESKLGTPAFFAEIIYFLSILDINRGDFNRAIKRLLEVVSIRERLKLNTGNASLMLALLHNVIEEPESGLAWAQMAENQFESRPYMINRGILIQIWSLILMKKITEAEILLSTTRASVLKSGDEQQLAWLHFVTGVLEIHRGDLTLASSSMDQALRIYENHKWGTLYETMILHHLAKIEVYSADIEDTITPSLAILEEKAISEDWPGILGNVLLLKAELAMMKDDDSQLREIVVQLGKIIETEDITFLTSHYDRLLSKL